MRNGQQQTTGPSTLFTLRQSLNAYRNYQQMIEECEREIRRALEQFHPANPPQASTSELPTPSSPTKPGSGRRSGDGVLRAELKQAIGIDLTQIPGIHTGIAQTLSGEIGPDFTKFRSASAFASWMGLCPDNEISGGRVLWVGKRKVNCRAATALRMAAQSLHHSKSALGGLLSAHASQDGRSESHHCGCPQTGARKAQKWHILQSVLSVLSPKLLILWLLR